jgi:hypothetical protein
VRLRKQWFDVPPRERLITGDQLPAFYAAVMALPNPVQRDYVLFLLFTGMRRAATTKSGRKLDLLTLRVRQRVAS